VVTNYDQVPRQDPEDKDRIWDPDGFNRCFGGDEAGSALVDNRDEKQPGDIAGAEEWQINPEFDMP